MSTGSSGTKTPGSLPWRVVPQGEGDLSGSSERQKRGVGVGTVFIALAMGALLGGSTLGAYGFSVGAERVTLCQERAIAGEAGERDIDSNFYWLRKAGNVPVQTVGGGYPTAGKYTINVRK